MYKGWFFVIVTASFLYGLIKRSTIRQKQIEQTNLETARKYSDLVENAHDLIFTADLKGNFKSINRAGEEITGYKRDEFLKLNFTDIVDKDDVEYLQMLFSDWQVIETFPSVEIKIRKKNGQKKILEVKNKLDIEEGKPISIQGIARDITERKFNEERLRESENQLRNLVETANEGIWTIDEDGKVGFVNKKLAEMLGYEQSEMLGKSFLDFVEDEMKTIAERNFKRRRSGIGEQIDYKLKKRGGSAIWVMASTNPLIRNNEFGGVLAMMSDINERRQNEEEKAKLTIELESQKSYLKYIISNIPGIVWETHFSSNPDVKDTLFVNDYVEKMLGYTVSDWVRTNDFWMEILHEDDREEMMKSSKELYGNPAINETVQQYRWVKKDGNVIWVETRMKIERDKSGKAFSARGVTIDITDRINIEKALAEKQKNLDFALKAGKLGTWHIDLRDDSMTYSDVLLENLGVASDSKFSLSRFKEMIHPEDRELHRQAIIKAIKTGEEFHCEHRVITSSGEIRWIDARGEVAFGKDKRAVSISGTAQNITERKLALEVLRETDERLNTVIENIAEGLIISDLNGNLLHWNKASLKMHGYTAQDEHLRPFEDFAETMELSTLDGKILSLDEWAISRVLKGETLQNFEVKIRRKDIEWERIFRYGGARVKDASGKEIAFLSITDITDKKRTENELKKLNDELERRVIERTIEVHQSEERLRLIGDNGTDGYWDWDLKTNETFMSQSFKALFGYEDKELPNHASTWQRLLLPEDRERAKQAYLDHINENKPYDLQIRYRHKNGSIVWVNCRGVALKNDTGEFVRMVGTHINITQQKLAEEALYKLNSQLEQRVLEKTKEVRQSELHFRQLSESLPLLVWTSRGEDGMCDYLSPQWVEYTGISEDLQLGFEWFGQIHPDDRQQTIDFWKQQSEKGEFFEIEFRIRRYDGVYRWFQSRAMPLKDANGKIIKWFGTNVDIDNRKLNEQTMQLLQNLSGKVAKSESLERAMTEILGEMRISTGWEVGEVWMPDEEKKQLTIIKSIFNGDNLLEKFSKKSGSMKFLPDEGLPGMVWNSKQPILMQNLHSDQRFKRRALAEKTGVKTGIGIPVLVQEDVLAVLTFFSKRSKQEDERSVKLITSVASQIGEFLQRKKAENELRQSRLRLQLGISVAKMAIIEIDVDNDICELSSEAVELFGFDSDKTKITREELRNMIHPEDRARIYELVKNATDTNGNGLLEAQHRIIRADGELRWLNVKEQFYFAKNINNQLIPHKAVLVFLDITDSKKMEETVRLSEERLRRLHEIVSEYALNYEEKIAEIIKLGNEIFEFESGVLGEINENHYKVLQAVSATADYAGFECDLSDTICEETVSINDTLVVENVADSQFREKAALTSWGLNSYFGIPIEKANKAFGTLCFISTKKLRKVITNSDREFLKIMAQWISAELTGNEAEEALRESEERFRILFEQSPAGTVVIDTETNQFVGCNSIATEVLGYTDEEICRLKIADLDVHKTAEESAQITQIVTEGNKVQYETVNRAKSGELKNLLVVSTGIQVKGKKYSYSSFLDITEMKKAQSELERERQRFEKIAAVSPSVIHSINITEDGKTSFPYISQAVAALYGETPDELKKDGSKVFEIVYPEDKQRIIDSIEISRQTMQTWNQVWRICSREKGEVWVEGHSAPVKESDGSVTWHGVLNDVTEKTRQANELAERERLITAIFNTAPSLIVLWDVVTGKVSYVNETARQILGFKPGNVLDFTKEDLFGRIHPDDTENVWRFIQTLLKSRDGEILTHEYRYRHPSGEWRVLLSQDTVFERDENGKVIKTLNILDDITERKIAERALRESEERFVKAFEANPAAVSFVRLSDGVIIDVNLSYEKIFGYSSSEVIGRRVTDINVLERPFELNEFLEILKRNATSKNSEISLRTKSGEIIQTLMSNELIELNGEQCVLAIMYDITDRKRAEEDLRRTEEKLLQAQKLESVGRLAGGIAHDFNNMLTAINGYSDLTLKQLGDNNPLRHNIEEIHKAGLRSAELTMQLLAFSRKQVLKPEVVNLNVVIRDTTALLKRLIGEDVVLETVLRPDIDNVKVDTSQLSQVIVNLAVNSRDAMPKGGILTIETSNVRLDGHFAELVGEAKAGEYVMLTVSDTGIGMSGEEKEHIFEPFYTTKEIGKGTGLGLSTVYGFVKQSEGYIWVYSEPDKGTSFKIYLPAVVGAKKENMKNDQNEQVTTGSETILLVEDEELVRNLNREILESYGYKVIEARNGVEALKIYSEGETAIDLLMTDVVMPEMGGSELALKLAETHPDLKVLFTSGYTDDAVVRHGVIDDSANFLQKPFSLDNLLNKVREILDK